MSLENIVKDCALHQRMYPLYTAAHVALNGIIGSVALSSLSNGLDVVDVLIFGLFGSGIYLSKKAAELARTKYGQSALFIETYGFDREMPDKFRRRVARIYAENNGLMGEYYNALDRYNSLSDRA